MAVWQTDIYGLDWLRELVKAGRAIDLGGNGYPSWYTVIAEFLLPRIAHEPPHANRVWICDPWDIIGEGWAGRTVVDRSVVEACLPSEWLLVEAWDES